VDKIQTLLVELECQAQIALNPASSGAGRNPYPDVRSLGLETDILHAYFHTLREWYRKKGMNPGDFGF
jgi:hypothetical protein